MPTLRGWTVSIRVKGQDILEKDDFVEGITAKCRVLCQPEEMFEMTMCNPHNDRSWVILVELDDIIHDETLISAGTTKDISCGWYCSKNICRPFKWLSEDYFDLRGGKKRREKGIGTVRVRFYLARPEHSLDPDIFLATPTKGRNTFSPKRLTHYAGMASFDKVDHPTRNIVGTVDNFESFTAGSPDLEFIFEYFHNILKPQNLKRGKVDMRSVVTHSPDKRRASQDFEPEKRARIDEQGTSSRFVIKTEEGRAPNLSSPGSAKDSRTLFLSAIRGQLKALRQEQRFLSSSGSLETCDIERKCELDAEIKVLEGQEKRYQIPPSSESSSSSRIPRPAKMEIIDLT